MTGFDYEYCRDADGTIGRRLLLPHAPLAVAGERYSSEIGVWFLSPEISADVSRERFEAIDRESAADAVGEDALGRAGETTSLADVDKPPPPNARAGWLIGRIAETQEHTRREGPHDWRIADASTPTFVPSVRFDRALARAVEIHRRQPRKGSGTPFVGHLLTVAGYVLEDGGSEDEAIAALLHDALEDQYRDELPTELREDFGPEVLGIVEGCSQERLPGEQLSWRERKQRYIDHLDEASDEVVRVSLADKLANVRSMLRDHRAEGERLWERFNAPRPKPKAVLWYYESLSERYATLRAGAMAEEFAHEVERLRAVVRGSAPGRTDG